MNGGNCWVRCVGPVLALAVVLGVSARAGAEELKPLAPTEKAFGLTLSEWAAAYWQWTASFTTSTDPRTDKTGLRAGIGQRMPVWFLPTGTQTMTAPRTILIPAGYWVLFTGPTVFAADGPEQTERLRAGLQDGTERFLNRLTKFEVSIDGVPIPDLQQYRVQTPMFTVVLPPSNVFGVPVSAGNDHRLAAMAEGYTLLLPPLPVGRHVLWSRVAGINPGTNKPFDDPGAINLIVQEPNKELP